MAPEALKGQEYSQKADLWSLGVVLYESLTGNFPWKSSSISSLSEEVMKGKVTFPKECSISSFWQNLIM